ncbi:MAG TPA: DNA oxidative demethylase AlkB [Legionella sp.]|nr:DNA oxidative demethylase AlkB [Legionella sp.]
MNLELFDLIDRDQYQEKIGEGAVILRQLAQPFCNDLLRDLKAIIQYAPFRHMITPNGFKMSVAMSNCGLFGWISDKKGYRYDSLDPLTGLKWPEIPPSFLKLAVSAADLAGFSNFNPDACLINRYETGAKLSLHQDKDEHDLAEPIVSISLGISAVFLFGGLKRTDKTQRYLLEHNDVVVFGGPARLRFHGILPIKQSYHPLTGTHRINLTFRKT